MQLVFKILSMQLSHDTHILMYLCCVLMQIIFENMPGKENKHFHDNVQRACKKVLKGGTIGLFGLHGMGGIGKTTLAKGMYNQLFKDFDHLYHGHVEFSLPYSDSDTNSKLSHLLTNDFGETSGAQEVDAHLHCYLKDKRVLLLFDNVSNVRQVARLRVICAGILMPGSLILFTSRQSSLFKAEELFLVRLLSIRDSYLLLCEVVELVGSKFPIGDLKDAIEEAAQACAGLPLTVKILGTFMLQKYRGGCDVVANWKVRCKLYR